MGKEELVLDVLAKAAKPLKSAEIAELGHLDKKDVDNAIKILKKEEKITSPKNCFYEIKK
ncbi:MAG: MarR family transcriptional regulator [Lentimicrobiaceae bacterium]